MNIKTRLLSVLTFGLVIALAFTACGDNTESCTITFEMGYTTKNAPPKPVTVKKGGRPSLPTPNRPAYDFTGWVDENGKAVNNDTVIDNDIVLTAQWHFTPGDANPIIRNYFTADPAPFVEDGVVYLVVGNDDLPPSSTAYYQIKQWLMYYSTDMKTFKLVENGKGGVILKSEDFKFGNPNTAWASQIIKGLDDRFYFYVTVEGSQGQTVGVAIADDVTGPYEAQPNPVVTATMTSQDAKVSTQNIDPTVLIDDDGTAYLMWGQSPLIAELNEDMTSIKRPIRRWAGYARSTSTPDPDPDNPFSAENPDGWKSEDTYAEGPYLFKRGKWYYMFYPGGLQETNNKCERISYSMAPSIHGPWTDGKVITDGAPGFGGGYCYTIHPGVVEFKGQAYMFYHNSKLSLEVNGQTWNGADGRRSVCVDYLYFNDDGKPSVTLSEEGLSLPPVDE